MCTLSLRTPGIKGSTPDWAFGIKGTFRWASLNNGSTWRRLTRSKTLVALCILFYMRTALRVGRPIFFFFLLYCKCTHLFMFVWAVGWAFSTIKIINQAKFFTLDHESEYNEKEKRKKRRRSGNRGGGRKITSSENNVINTIVNHTQLSIVGSWFILGVTTGSHPKQTSTFSLAREEFPPLMGPCSIPARRHPCGNTNGWKREKRSWGTVGGGWVGGVSPQAILLLWFSDWARTIHMIYDFACPHHTTRSGNTERRADA